MKRNPRFFLITFAFLIGFLLHWMISFHQFYQGPGIFSIVRNGTTDNIAEEGKVAEIKLNAQRSENEENSPYIRMKSKQFNINKTCSRMPEGEDIFRGINAHKIRKGIFGHLLVLEKEKAVYCPIAKVGSSNWHRIISKWSDVIQNKREINWKNYTFLSSFNMKKQKEILKTYYKFMFIRDPYERLFSAYWDKFGTNYKSGANYDPNQYYPSVFGKKISKYNRNESIRIDPKIPKSVVTFEQFLRYILDTSQTRSDPHWATYSSWCEPCWMNYDFIGEIDHIEEDSNYIMKKIGHENDRYPKKQKWYQTRTEKEFTKENVMNAIPRDLKEAVIKKLRYEYELFGLPRKH